MLKSHGRFPDFPRNIQLFEANFGRSINGPEGRYLRPIWENRMQASGGIVRFFLFVAVVAWALTGYYARSLLNSINKDEATIMTLTTERDSWKSKFDIMEKQASENATELREAQAKVAEIQAKVDAASTIPKVSSPTKERRRK